MFDHDREMFDNPAGWNKRPVSDSPLFTSLDEVWDNGLSSLYERELSALAYKSIPTAKSVIKSVSQIMGIIQSSGIR